MIYRVLGFGFRASGLGFRAYKVLGLGGLGLGVFKGVFQECQQILGSGGLELAKGI